MPFDQIDLDTRRRSLKLLASYVLQNTAANDEEFNHHFMNPFEAASWLVCSLKLATPTRTGFKLVLAPSLRAEAIASIQPAELPLLEDAVHIALKVCDFFYTIPLQPSWPPAPDFLPEEFDQIFEILALQDEDGNWGETALPVLLRAGCFDDGAATTCPHIKDFVAEQARLAIGTMPQAIVDVMREDELAGKPGERLADYISNSWRPGTWLSAEQRKASRNYMTNPLTMALAREILAQSGSPRSW